jgi:hypothetical protein
MHSPHPAERGRIGIRENTCWDGKFCDSAAEQHGPQLNYIEELRKQGWKEDPKPNRSSKLEAERLLQDYRKTSKKA